MPSVSPFPALLLSLLLLSAGACQPTPRVERGKPKIVRQIRERGLDYTAREFRTQAHEGNLENVRLFLEAGMDPDIRRHWRANLALYEACRAGHPKIATLLLQHGAAVDGQTHRLGRTPLMAAAGRGHLPVMELLLEADAEVDARSATLERTPLMLAAKRGQAGSVQLLLAAGAEPSLRDAEGRAALDLAREHQRTEVIAILEDRP